MFEMHKDEMREEFLERIYTTDKRFSQAREDRNNDVAVKDILTDDFVAYCFGSGLSSRDLAKIVKISKSSINNYILAWRDRVDMKDIYTTAFEYDDIKIAFNHDDIKGGKYIEHVFLLVSDIQAGAMITALGYDGDPIATVNSYFENLIKNTVKTLNSRNLHIGTLNIMMLGDMVEGVKIFPKQLTILIRPQMDIIVKNMLQMIEYFAGQDFINEVDVYGVFGNHGRISWEHSSTDNFDQMAYDRIHERINLYKEFGHGNYAKVNSYITDDAVQCRRIGRFNYAYTHGDQIGGLSDGRLIKMFGEIKDVFEDEIETGRVDVMLLGHWHCMRWLIHNQKSIIVNGCTYESPFARYRILKKSDIIQVLFGQSEHEAVAWLDRIRVTE